MSISSVSEFRHHRPSASHPLADGGPGTGTATHSLDLTDFLRIVRQQAPLIALAAALALALAVAYILSTPSRFTASSNILINPQPKRVFGADTIPQDGNTNQILIESQTRVIASHAVLARVVESERLADDPEFAGSHGGIASRLKSLLGLAAPASSRSDAERHEAALYRLDEQLAVKRPSLTYVVEIAVTANDAEKAARLSRAVAEAYIADQVEAQTAASRETTEILQERLAVLRQRVLDADSRIQEFRQRHNIVASEGALINERELNKLNDELLLARSRMSEAQAKADRVRRLAAVGSVPDSIDEAVNSRLVANLKEQYARSARRESQLASVYGARHPQLIAARAEVERTRGLIQSELSRLAGALGSEVDVEKKRVAGIEQRLRASRGVTDTTNKARVELASLEQEANASRAVYDRVLAKARETSAEENLNSFDARIISYATVPLWASWPKKSVILPLALLFGLGIGIAGALVNDYRQDRFASAREIERNSGLRLIGSIPSLAPRPAETWARRLRRARTRPGDTVRDSYFRLYQELATVGSPYATAVMSFLRQVKPAGSSLPPRSVMLVSAAANDGVSSLAWSTAIAAAMQNRRILLIDGDGGTGELSRTLAPGHGDRLRQVIAGTARLSDLLIEDAELGISFLPLVGAGDRNSSNWHDYQTLLARLPQLYTEYDLVVVDGGALRDSGLAHLLVDLVDAVALVVRSDETRRADVLEARQALAVGEHKLIGVVASMVDPRSI